MKLIKDLFFIALGVAAAITLLVVLAGVLNFLTAWMGPVQPVATAIIALWLTHKAIKASRKLNSKSN